jgi:hypothetical protein
MTPAQQHEEISGALDSHLRYTRMNLISRPASWNVLMYDALKHDIFFIQFKWHLTE